jgi:hypothetical protein
VLHLAYDLADFELVRAHWTGYFVRKHPPGSPVRALRPEYCTKSGPLTTWCAMTCSM